MIGPETGIKVWLNSWMSLREHVAPIGPPTLELQNLRVSDLVLPNSGEWNIPVIRVILPHYEDMIRELVPSCYMEKDEQVWLFTKTAKYSTKSGYKILSQPPYLMDRQFNWINNVWKVETTPKVKTFLWKLHSGALASKFNLAARGISMNIACKRCGEPRKLTFISVSIAPLRVGPGTFYPRWMHLQSPWSQISLLS